MRISFCSAFLAVWPVLLFCGDQSLAQEKVTVETVNGEVVSGRLEGVSKDGSLLGTEFSSINIAQVLSIKTERSAKPASDDLTEIKLLDGGQLFVKSVTMDAETIRFTSNIKGVDSISVQSVAAVVFRTNDLIKEALSRSSTDEDVVLVDRGESVARVAGVLESLDAEKLQLNYKGESRKINLEKVAAVLVADLGLRRPSGDLATVSLVDGSVVRGVLRSLEADSLSIELTGKQTLTISRQYMVSLSIESDSIAYLSSLQPVDVVQQPQFTVERPWRRNQSVEGNPLRLLVGTPKSSEQEGNAAAAQIRTFAKGIGTSSYSRIEFENTKGFTRFMALAGIDAETEGRGDCEMRVEGDGITLWSNRVRGADVAVEVDVDISGISRVALVVEPGEQFDLADHADWARARFLKTD